MKMKSKPTPPMLKAIIGENYLNFGEERDGVLYIPSSYDFKKHIPLLVFFHGAGGGVSSLKKFYRDAENFGIAVLLIESRERTWDIIFTRTQKGLGEFNRDAKFLDKALRYTFNRCLIDYKKIALGGFSDGASYALSLGALNGELFTHIIAVAPGFIKHSNSFIGKPKIYITHGREDKALSIQYSQQRTVPYLKEKNYDVTYVEHNEGHLINSEIVEKFLNWFLGEKSYK